MIQSENVIEVKNLKKKFKVYLDKGSDLKEKVLFRKRNQYEDRWVLKGINFSIKKGESVGLIGKNGCGKSTTLKLLSRIIYPTEGTIEIRGRVSSLLELGAGFHPDMSGRENIYTNASIFGLTKKEIDNRLDKIIAFSELEEFIDNPVRTYSSGMYMRLAFSVAINVDADILLIDEILAVGDIGFQTKCMEKLREIKKGGTTIIIVSHAMGQIEQICDRVIWIEGGRIKEDGIPKFIDDKYLASMEEKRLSKIEKSQKQHEKRPTKSEERHAWSERMVRSGNRSVEVVDVAMVGTDYIEKNVYKTGETITVLIDYKANQDIKSADFTIGIVRDDGLYCYGSGVMLDSQKPVLIQKEGQVQIQLLKNELLPGKYLLDVGIQSGEKILYDEMRSVLEFFITTDRITEYGIVSMEHTWQVDGQLIEKV